MGKGLYRYFFTMDISPMFITDEQTLLSMEPGKSPLDNPTVLSKMGERCLLIVWQFGVLYAVL